MRKNRVAVNHFQKTTTMTKKPIKSENQDLRMIRTKRRVIKRYLNLKISVK
jgi:hypothetical protein